jgi:predicted methyltransferase
MNLLVRAAAAAAMGSLVVLLVPAVGGGLECLAGMLAPQARSATLEDAALNRLVEGSQRGAANVARDHYRHPYEVLRFFGLRANQTVVEILPGGAGAYWPEILAPYLRDRGKYIAAIGDDEASNAEARVLNPAFRNKVANTPQLYDRVIISEFGADRHDIAPPGTADMVLTFRNVHNWMASGEADAVFRTFYKALKPGGVLGVEEHRGRTDQPQDPAAKSGYVRSDFIVALAQKAGFQFAASSEVNANPKDTKDYSAGVWTLPPNYRLGDQDRVKYAAIGESDRALLKFVKPAK